MTIEIKRDNEGCLLFLVIFMALALMGSCDNTQIISRKLEDTNTKLEKISEQSSKQTRELESQTRELRSLLEETQKQNKNKEVLK